MSNLKNEYNNIMQEVNEAVITERSRQDELYGIQVRPVGEWLAIVMEEVGEAAQAAQPLLGIGTCKPTDATNYYAECIQAAAVFSRMAEQALFEHRHGLTAAMLDADEKNRASASCQHEDWKEYDDGPWPMKKCKTCGEVFE